MFKGITKSENMVFTLPGYQGFGQYLVQKISYCTVVNYQPKSIYFLIREARLELGWNMAAATKYH